MIQPWDVALDYIITDKRILKPKKEEIIMSVVTNIREFWERFEDEQSDLQNALKTKNYDLINEIVQGLNEEVNAISGCSFL